MEKEIEVGEYVRTYNGDITKVKGFLKEKNIYSIVGEDDLLYGNPNKVVKKYSKNLIDLIEVGDVIEYKINNISTTLETKGYLQGITDIADKEMIQNIKNDSNSKILSIVTKEQFKNAEYRIEEE